MNWQCPGRGMKRDCPGWGMKRQCPGRGMKRHHPGRRMGRIRPGRGMQRLALAALAMLAAAPARAVDEIQVYTGEIAAPGEWSLLQHLNYGLRARQGRDYQGALPNRGTLNGTPELAYGVTPAYEIGLYLPFAARDDRFYAGGFKLRSLLVTPDAAERSVFYGLNTELSWAPPRFSRSAWNLEFRPILGIHRGRWELATNPILGLGIGGHAATAFLPANRISYAVRADLGFGVETYSDLGSPGRFPSAHKQAHQVFAVTDFRLGVVDVNFGLGRGLTGASDRWAVKTIFGFSF
ncbi:MAG: hypothetical protein JWP04_1690 [Belnapia sp.]|nr:hypothetical protein [Belnapia sp.]